MSTNPVKLPTNDTLNGGMVRLGIDRPTGHWFCQVYDEKTTPVETHDEIDRNGVMNLIRKYGDMENVYTKNVLRAVSLDLDPATLPVG